MSTHPTSTDPFTGRSGELAALQRQLTAAMDGQSGVALLAGEPGIGKTRLAEEAAAAARSAGMQVLWGRCYEGEGAPAFWPWIQVLRGAIAGRDPATLRTMLGADTAYLLPLAPDLGDDAAPGATFQAENAEERFRLFAAFTALLSGIAATPPLLLIIDDLHWADTSSLLLFEFLAREARAARLLLIGTYRDTEVGADLPLSRTLARLARLPGLRISLSGLDATDVATLIARTTGAPASPALIAAVYETTEGNPFFVGELMRYQQDSEGLRAGAPLAIPPSVHAVIGLRVGELSPACNHLLTLAAVIGREFPLRALELVSEGPGGETLAALEEAEEARLIAPAGV